LVGNSGCGKSSLALAVLGLTKARSGRVWFDGLELNLRSERAWRPLRRRLQVVFQDQWSALDPRQRVGAALREPMALHGIGGGRGERDERAAQLLREVGLAPDLLRRLPYELSGGERQRVAIARALAVGPELLICDEAVSSLDAVARAQVLDLLGELCHRRGLACLFISHDLGVIEAVADEVAVMADGRIVEFGACERICQAAASAAGRALMAARLR
jgi:peptide/nickel transport system ATP-binding protein